MTATSTELALGEAAPSFALPGIDGTVHTLDELAGANGTVVAFICNHCPYVKAVAPLIVRDARALREHGVALIAINSNDAVTYPEDSFDNMKHFAAANGFDFAYLFDESQDVARAYGAICTPDFFGFDAKRSLRYRGRLDASRKELVPNAPRELYDAMVAIARGGSAPATQNPSIGCSVKWKLPAD